MAYSIDFIKAAVAYKQSGFTFKQLRETFGIPPETYYLWEEKLGNGYYGIKKDKQKRHRKIDRELLKQAVAKKPDSFLYELAELFNCSEPAIFYMLQKMNITLKKRPSPTVKNLN